MDIVTKFLEENNINVPYFVRKEEGKLSLEKEDDKRLYDLGSRVKNISYVSISYFSISVDNGK